MKNISKNLNQDGQKTESVVKDHQTKQKEFRKELKSLINSYSIENGSNTPDFILANYLLQCLQSFDDAVACREQWYGRSTCPSENTEDVPKKPKPSGLDEVKDSF